MININIQLNETDDGVSIKIEGNKEGEATKREFALGKAISNFVNDNARMLLKASEAESVAGGVADALKNAIKDAAVACYGVTKDEFDAILKDCHSADELKAALEEHEKSKAKKAGDEDEGKSPADPSEDADTPTPIPAPNPSTPEDDKPEKPEA